MRALFCIIIVRLFHQLIEPRWIRSGPSREERSKTSRISRILRVPEKMISDSEYNNRMERKEMVTSMMISQSWMMKRLLSLILSCREMTLTSSIKAAVMTK